ncbi:MAG: 16S rRNA (guanine(966)-N(2))-methyltransferase RsmD [Bacilli bacterium]|nr:16S rRNA (guanine(966)-N(2))-methyltransferase RsmD [Bacilli bacterium]
MRVVGGLYRHRELVWPKVEGTRPTKDMVREAIFSAISSKLTNSVVLDLFAGSGAMAIEAISRGASFGYLVDNSYDANIAIKENLTNLKINNAKVYSTDYLDALNDLKNHNVKIDVLFLDPPYKMNEYEKFISEANDLLNEHAVIVIESDAQVKINGTYNKIKEYRYGKTFVTILWR